MSMVKLKALSLWQPWASLWVHGEKKIESRSWYPLCVTPPFTLAIHASKKWNASLADMCRDDPFCSAIERIGYRWSKHVSLMNDWANPFMPFGAMLGTVEVYGFINTNKIVPDDEKEKAFGNYSPDRLGWLARNFNPFKTPIPMIGRQGIFNVEIDDALLYKGETV
jgi:hypothetical protein